MPDCVEHYLEGRAAWKLGFLGFCIRLRGLVSTLLLTIITMGAPFWWPDNFPSSFNISLKLMFISSIGIFGIILTLAFYYVRYRYKRDLDIKHLLHEFSHFLRDHQTKVYKRCLTSTPSHDVESERLCIFIEQLCERSKELFRRLTGDSTIESAFRIAVDKSQISGKHEIWYHTMGRSSGLSKQREDTSQDIAGNEGIPRFFSDKNSQGVLIYNDLNKAAAVGAFKLTENDSKYADEIRTMMVAPLNAWDGKRQSMIGIIYITSRERKTFSANHVDSLRFIADKVAKAIGFTVENLKQIGCVKTLLRSK